MAATAEMLAAQAQGGSAGVQAYLAAQQEIAARQQATVAQMQADAISRNSPAVAQVGAQSAIGTDALLNQLAVLQANAGAEGASRSARMSDYARQAAMAGGLIPLQAQADADLIRARGQTEIAGIEASGRNRLEERRLTFAQQQQAREQDRRDQIEYIKWQMRQDEAKASAEAAAKAAKENTLSATELEAMATLNARDTLAGKARSTQRAAANAPLPVDRATRQANGNYLLNPSILQRQTLQPSKEQKAEYEKVTGKSADGLTLDQVQRVIGGVMGPTELAQQQAMDEKFKAQADALKQKVSDRKKDQLLGTKIRRKTAYDARVAAANYSDPLAMQNEVANQAAALRSQGYVVTPEVMAQLLNQPFLSASQMDARDQGLPYTDAQQYAAFNRQQAMAGDGLDPLRADLNTAYGLNLDDLLSATDVTPEAASAYFNDPNFSNDKAEFEKFVADDPKAAEIDAWLRANTSSPAQARILRYLVLGK